MPELGIDLLEFLKFTELPGLLGEQFFNALDLDHDARLSLEEFMTGFLLMYKGSKEEISEVLFAVLDFNRKGYVTLQDMRCVLPYLPASCPKCSKRVTHTWKMEEKISAFFSEHEILTYENVVELMEEHQDLFNDILEALLSSLPAIFDEAMKRPRRNSCAEECKSECSSPRPSLELKTLKMSGRRYFVDLRNQALYYYNSVDQSSPKGIILIKDLFVSPIGSIGFELKNIKFSYQFEASSQAERDEWVERILRENKFRWFDDHYETKEQLGAGAYGQVLKCINRKTGAVAAVKIVSKEAMDWRSEGRLRRELDILHFAKHPNLLELYDVFETCERIYIVTEYLDCGTLFEYLEQSSFHVKENVSKRIVADVARGLQFLHENGIIHRDIKLENIMMKREKKNFRAVIIDYGLSCFLGPDQTSNEPVGTLKYVAPEIISRLSYREKVDGWSLGVILYILLQGTVPFYGKSDQDVALRILKRHIHFEGDKWTSISREAVPVVSGLLNRKVDKRLSLAEVLSSEWILQGEEEEEPGIEVPVSFALTTPFQALSVK
jgi:Ca2+-binding EF-hand superfamily protein